MAELKVGIKRYVRFYNTEGFHQSWDYLTPEQAYNSKFKNLMIWLRVHKNGIGKNPPYFL